MINYTQDTRTATADITTAKLIINITISMQWARYMRCDFKKYYLGTILIWYKYIKIPIDIIPMEIIQEYILTHLAYNSYVYCEI